MLGARSDTTSATRPSRRAATLAGVAAIGRDLPQLGVLSYGAPVLSTLLLCLAGHAEASPRLLAACALVAAGGLVATARAGAPSTPRANNLH
ncbi:hypothetical protein [Sorangium sp. So ce1151]|uniref:hypothetical protein n=1 Tax=Sorangium sp. So ce1151 TaxID=3133332 RepID=UPI003F5E6D5B